MKRKTGRGPKDKGRDYENEVQAAILAKLGSLSPNDISVRAMGDPGVDLLLSDMARELFPLAAELKRTEHLELYKSLAQAEIHGKKEGLAPALIFRRNRSKSYVILQLDTLLDLLAERAFDRGYSSGWGVR